MIQFFNVAIKLKNMILLVVKIRFGCVYAEKPKKTGSKNFELFLK
ncbi:MAG: hypothetical protein RLZZ161_1612 [Bacteroidota bacterium]